MFNHREKRVIIPMNRPLRILLSNDDGFHAAGLQALYQAIKDKAEVTIVAPDRERSAVGHGITMHHPLRVEPVQLDGQTHWTVDGTPSDCVKLALEKVLLDRRPDLVISGINRGPNLGSDVLYSGTVSAAIEGHMYGIPSMAASVVDFGNADFSLAARFLVEHLEQLLELASHSLININFPTATSLNPKVRFTKLGRLNYINVFEERKDPRGRTYYWMGGEPEKLEQDADSDIRAVEEGDISITPLIIDLTNYQFLQSDYLKSFQWEK